MARAWHTPREPLNSGLGAGAQLWRARKYALLDDPKDPAVIGAVPEAFVGVAWQRYRPFDWYRPTSNSRDVKAGPHLSFLKLKKLWQDHRWEEIPHKFHKHLNVFAHTYGLLGAFEETYLRRPISVGTKALVAPEAVIDDYGRLRKVDPATEGKELLLDLLKSREWWSPNHYGPIVLPRQLEFVPKDPTQYPYIPQVLMDRPPRPAPWEEVKEHFGAQMLLDEEAFMGVSVLCLWEPIRFWTDSLRFFPSVDTPVEDLAGDEYNSLNSYLEEVSPCALIGEDGNLGRGWRCRSLLQAMYLMLFLDLTGGNTIKQCQSRGCPNYYFRAGPQSKSIYCSERCASRASTRMGRGQEP